MTSLLFILISSGALSQQKPVLNHLALDVVDLQRSTVFYRDIIGLDTIPEPFHDGMHTWFRIGPLSHLHLISTAPSSMVHPKNNHLCFRVDKVEDFIPRLKKAGIVYEDVPGNKNTINIRPDGVKQIYFRDPDGYWIEINDAKD